MLGKLKIIWIVEHDIAYKREQTEKIVASHFFVVYNGFDHSSTF
jgi:hypothetical protein